ncbi:37_t:CDS:2 [Entrophospora sp. SA101]|nr:37_t:CDS:2 [Entrophospora sp. SA101]
MSCKKIECITVKYYRAGTPYLPPEAIEEIIQSRGSIKNASKTMADKYKTSTRRVYEIWKRHAKGLPLRKQQMIYSKSDLQNNNSFDMQIKKEFKPVHISEPIPNSAPSSINSNNLIKNISNKLNSTSDIISRLKQEEKRKEKNLAKNRHLLSTN